MFPQEIFDEIIVHLADDLSALCTCSATAFALHLPAIKHIFSTVHLSQSLSCVSRLLTLLDPSPDIALLIHTLYIHACSENTNLTLSILLPRLTHVQNLVVGPWDKAGRWKGTMNWNTLPLETKYALETLFTSATLRTLMFTAIIYLPISTLSLAGHVKTLKLDRVAFTNPEITPPPAPSSTATSPLSLEALHCTGSVSDPAFRSLPVQAPHLRQYTIVGNSPANLRTVQDLCTAMSPACAIDDLTWLDFRGDDPFFVNQGASQSLLSHPHRLTFSTWTFDIAWAQRIPAMWDSITALLGAASLSALEEFSVTLKCANSLVPEVLPDAEPLNPLYSPFDEDEPGSEEGEGGGTCLGASHAWWAQLDTCLGHPVHAPRLRAVRFGLEIVDLDGEYPSSKGISDKKSEDGILEVENGVTEGVVAEKVGELLPALSGAGVLSVSVSVKGGS